jgi:hypothetical protein
MKLNLSMTKATHGGLTIEHTKLPRSNPAIGTGHLSFKRNKKMKVGFLLQSILCISLLPENSPKIEKGDNPVLLFVEFYIKKFPDIGNENHCVFTHHLQKKI